MNEDAANVNVVPDKAHYIYQGEKAVKRSALTIRTNASQILSQSPMSVLHSCPHVRVVPLCNGLVLGWMLLVDTRGETFDDEVRIRGDEIWNGISCPRQPVIARKPVLQWRQSNSVRGRSQGICKICQLRHLDC